MIQQILSFQTHGRGTIDIGPEIANVVNTSTIKTGLCHLFLQHTSASLILCENYDPDVRRDLETFTADWVPDGDHRFKHTMEGPDDMPAHIRSIFSHNDITIPIVDGKLALGTWQGIFLWEHRLQKHTRRVVVTLL